MNQRVLFTIATIVAATVLSLVCTASAQQRIRDISRVKGQEENTLHGVGLVVGLNGTGDPSIRSTIRALGRTLELMGMPLARDQNDLDLLDELKDAKNSALVFVTATVPAAGARRGDQLHCAVHAFGSAKSLAGGHLMLTTMLGPRPSDNPAGRRVYALAQGAIQLENSELPVSGKIHNGCRLEENFNNAFSDNGLVTIVLDKNHASFRNARLMAQLINQAFDAEADPRDRSYEAIAHAVDQVNVLVKIPPQYARHEVQFVYEILDIRIPYLESDARVVVNERTGTVIIGAKVEIAPVAVTHKNFTIEAGPFFPIDLDSVANSTAGPVRNVKLKALVDALNALKASPQDIIDIIKGLKQSGDLYGELIIQ